MLESTKYKVDKRTYLLTLQKLYIFSPMSANLISQLSLNINIILARNFLLASLHAALLCCHCCETRYILVATLAPHGIEANFGTNPWRCRIEGPVHRDDLHD